MYKEQVPSKYQRTENENVIRFYLIMALRTLATKKHQQNDNKHQKEPQGNTRAKTI